VRHRDLEKQLDSEISVSAKLTFAPAQLLTCPSRWTTQWGPINWLFHWSSQKMAQPKDKNPNDFLVADAVRFELLSKVQFPAKREIIREFLEFWLLWRDVSARSSGKFNDLP
jgi:hypothetical protein